MKGLIIKKVHLDNIISGEKTWEIRSSNTKIRGKIALIESGSGTVVGTAYVSDSFALTDKDLLKNIDKHLVPKKSIKAGLRYKRPHAWVLTKAKRLKKPKPYKHKKGAVIWVEIGNLKI